MFPPADGSCCDELDDALSGFAASVLLAICCAEGFCDGSLSAKSRGLAVEPSVSRPEMFELDAPGDLEDSVASVDFACKL